MTRSSSKLLRPSLLGLLVVCCQSHSPAQVDAQEVEPLPTADGYRGIWYANQPSDDEYRFKYSGGCATYPQQHVPIAYYSAVADKTFFVYGGSSEDGSLLHMVSYFDHATGTVPRPRVLMDKHTKDAHDNPTLMLDGEGHLWIFSNAHGTSRPSYIHRSLEPHSIDAFERVVETNFSYSQPWHVEGRGFCFLHTRYRGGRRVLFCQTSADGRAWAEARILAEVATGHYQISWRHGSVVGTALNYHPEGKGLNWRTNLYYMETPDGGQTWRNARGDTLELPLAEVKNPALAAEYESQERLVYLKDLQYDEDDHPVILFLTSAGHESGPENAPRVWHTARWTGERWVVRDVTRSDHNYDFGSLYLEQPDLWRLIGTTEVGPQPYNTGGEIAMWLSRDRGASWVKKQLTADSSYNHSYPRRPVHAHPDFYALWADGHGRERSPSRIYFCDREGNVYRLPERIESESARPVRL